MIKQKDCVREKGQSLLLLIKLQGAAVKYARQMGVAPSRHRTSRALADVRTAVTQSPN